ncbi:hypothetical protein ACTXLV_16565 [Brachybacterium alimentarium]|uniref:hypothetical protein n=1 Tax=Brachybacterium alimentarium TaxID=47845 RepID=UPI003FD1D044
MNSHLRAGFSTVPLPPPTHGYLAGYAVRERWSTGLEHPLTATIARFDQGDAHRVRTLIWVGIDALAISAPLRSAIRAAVAVRVPSAEVLVSATHTHSAPGAWCGSIHPILPADIDTDQITQAARRIGTAVPTTLSVHLLRGTAPVTGVGTNRHDPDRPADTSVGVLAAQQGDRIIGLIVDHACHPTVLGRHSTMWSPDWVGGLRRGLAGALGPDTPVLFLQGAAGDISTRFTRRASSVAEAGRIGSRVAEGALAALASATPVDLSAGLGVERHHLSLHRRDAAFDAQQMSQSTTRQADDTSGPGLLRARREGAAGLRALAAEPGPKVRDVPVTDVRIGVARYLTVPFELQNAWGRALSEMGDLRVVGYTDAYAGYLSDSAAHAEGVYEATSSFADAVESEALMEQLQSIAAPPEHPRAVLDTETPAPLTGRITTHE